MFRNAATLLAVLAAITLAGCHYNPGPSDPDFYDQHHVSYEGI